MSRNVKMNISMSYMTWVIHPSLWQWLGFRNLITTYRSFQRSLLRRQAPSMWCWWLAAQHLPNAVCFAAYQQHHMLGGGHQHLRPLPAMHLPWELGYLGGSRPLVPIWIHHCSPWWPQYAIAPSGGRQNGIRGGWRYTATHLSNLLNLSFSSHTRYLSAELIPMVLISDKVHEKTQELIGRGLSKHAEGQIEYFLCHLHAYM